MPADQRIDAPDYIGIGAPRAGSTWVGRLIQSHPDVVRQPWGKELHFFDRFYDREFRASDISDYHSYFPRREGSVTGEFTPGYMYQPWSRSLIERAAPDALLLVVLRDPLAQFESSVNYSAYHGAPENGLMVSRHLGEAAYWSHLHLWTDVPKERMMVIQSERSFDHPTELLTEIWTRLGLEPSLGVVGRRNKNEARQRTISLTAETRRKVVEYLEPDVAELARQFDNIDLELWPAFAHLT